MVHKSSACTCYKMGRSLLFKISHFCGDNIVVTLKHCKYITKLCYLMKATWKFTNQFDPVGRKRFGKERNFFRSLTLLRFTMDVAMWCELGGAKRQLESFLNIQWNDSMQLYSNFLKMLAVVYQRWVWKLLTLFNLWTYSLCGAHYRTSEIGWASLF